MTQQRDLRLIRLKNVNPVPPETQRYDYHLYRKNSLICHQLSDNEFTFGLVTINGLDVHMELCNKYSEKMEDETHFW